MMEMKAKRKLVVLLAVFLTLPLCGFSQLAEEMRGLHGVLDNLYHTMMPLCSELIGVGQAIAGFAATFYIGYRIWRHIANAEPVDFFPLFRPFVLGFCITIFPAVLGLINAVMEPTVTGTAAMMEGSNLAIEELLRQKEEAVQNSDIWQMYVGESENGDRDAWYKYTYGADPEEESALGYIGNSMRFGMEKMSYNFRNAVKEWMSVVLLILFEAAALCINTLRTFQMVVLSVLGPLVFGLAVFDGLQHTLVAWLARYINVFLWLPVANIFGSIIGKIQQEMLKIDISQIDQYGDTFFSKSDAAYLVFMIIGIIGYFTVPSVANFIVQAGGGGFTPKVTNTLMSGAGGAATMAVGAAGGAVVLMGRGVEKLRDFMSNRGGSDGGGNKDGGKGNSSYMADKLKGK